MKLNKTDLHNMGCLKLREMDVWDSQTCLDNLKWGKRTSERSQERYVKRLMEKLLQIEMKEPGLIDYLFDQSIQPKINELKQIKENRNVRGTTNRNQDKEESNTIQGEESGS